MLKNIITFLGLLLLLAFGYYLFVLDRGGLETNNDIVANQADAEAREFLQRLNDLKTVNLETSILSDTRFSSLVDFSTPVDAALVGRDNPFVPAN